VRFEGQIPAERIGQFWRWLPLLLAVRVGVNLAFGLHRWSFRLSGLHEALRVAQVSLLGSALLTTGSYFAQRAVEDISIGPPRSVIIIELLLTTILLTASRFSLRVAGAWGVNVFRPRVGDWARTLIVGAGSAGELLLRDLQRSDEHNYSVVGFVDDNRTKWGATIGGRQVLGSLDELPRICERWRIEQILFAIPRLPAERMRHILDICRELKLRYKSIPVSYAYLNDRQAVSRLQDLAPEDLLRRHPVEFAGGEIRAQVAGERLLVTGAAGSIGSEICRQLAEHEPASLVLADIDENGLYLLYRDLQREHPGLVLVPEVIDIRDEDRVRQLGEEHRPQMILHAAAHKHVPLMERNPEEAVKNNLLGCRNVVTMADHVGARRFVLISTDKAVEPVSVMGVTKMLAEHLVRQWHGRSSTCFNVVRFGNVLGSAGSMVPLFKEQIGHGGPVTVTDRECTRFLMTIHEAVGLTLLAGLSGQGGLFVLEMGEPIRVLDLARLMITLTGRVPDLEIPIVFTGLRPGEKLVEKLMTEAEVEGAHPVCAGVLAVQGIAEGPDIEGLLPSLADAAKTGDRGRLLGLLSQAAPGYCPHGLEGRSASMTGGLDERRSVIGLSSAGSGNSGSSGSSGDGSAR